MGTRHFVGVVADGEFKVAQYGQWDGYPSGQGMDVLTFASTMDPEVMLAEVRDVRFLSEEDRAQMKSDWEAVGANESGWVTMEQSDQFYSNPKYAAMSRDVGASVLNLVYEGKVDMLDDSSDFPKNSLWCEWAYVIDLDKRQLEVYGGFGKDLPKNGRWAGVREAGEEYAACEMLALWPLDSLPDKDTFLQTLEPNDEEDD